MPIFISSRIFSYQRKYTREDSYLSFSLDFLRAIRESDEDSGAIVVQTESLARLVEQWPTLAAKHQSLILDNAEAFAGVLK